MMTQAPRLAIPTRGRIHRARSGKAKPPPAVALAGQPCPLRAALLEKTGRDEEVVPPIEQRGWHQEKERDETVPRAWQPYGAEGGTSGSPSVCEGD